MNELFPFEKRDDFTCSCSSHSS